MNGPERVLALCRFLHEGSALLLWGASAYLAVLVPPKLGREIGRRLMSIWIVGALIAITTTVALLPTEAAVIGDGWRDAFRPAIIDGVLFDTNVGTAWIAAMGAAVLLGLTTIRTSPVRLSATAASSGLLVGTLTLTGHAAMHEGWLGLAHRLNATLHVLAAGAWLGALLPLVLLLKILDEPAWQAEANSALRRFSTAGHAAVALVIATGMLNTALILGRWPTTWSSTYQAMLALKIALVAVITALAIRNRYGLVPMLRNRHPQALDAIRRNTIVILGLGLAAIGCVSIFGMLEPA
ncbi:copper homeostasis membrane protein CopD [Lichenifustis flavocetrariae]|uniref:Copper homeostasis membrane protein CopD n=1 Tax=Lichenifustis flavocetrariae TaxID=2949735 RepID=A0AA41YYW7_9HYPH|nr:copper homeostasis membrane protein CopD [Lichenifustis flavocetrariae]MCW6511129.1 copper homeostasis membrane protein CopD [Lichenifustis flavocetrariae]